MSTETSPQKEASKAPAPVFKPEINPKTNRPYADYDRGSGRRGWRWLAGSGVVIAGIVVAINAAGNDDPGHSGAAPTNAPKPTPHPRPSSEATKTRTAGPEHTFHLGAKTIRCVGLEPYTVQSGDTLTGIARTHHGRLGVSAMLSVIEMQNHAAVKNPDFIEVQQHLEVPQNCETSS